MNWRRSSHGSQTDLKAWKSATPEGTEGSNPSRFLLHSEFKSPIISSNYTESQSAFVVKQ